MFEIKSIVGLGGFENIRNEYSWEGYTLEVDETIYDFGTNFEIECETVGESFGEMPMDAILSV